MAKRPGGEMAARPLHFMWIADISGSMSLRGKIESLNIAVRTALPQMQKVAFDNPHASVLMRVMGFSHGASWYTPEPVPLEKFDWSDLRADPFPQATADVVFLLDTSGSMGDEIDAIKNSCVDFADQIDKRGARVRLGLIGFDIGGHRARRSLTYCVHQLSTYTIGVWPLASPNDFKVAVGELSLGLFGGMGCYLADADSVDIFAHVVHAYGDSTATSRIVVIVSDEIGSADGVAAIVSQLKSAGITTYVLGVPGRRKAHEQIAVQTGGKFWSIFETKGRHDFSSLLSSVAESIAEEVMAKLPDGTISAGTDMGQALRLVSEQLRMPPMPDRALPPVLVLLSDGKPTDDFTSALKTLMDQPWGRKAVRLAIAIGDDADTDVLDRFMAHPELKPLKASSPEALASHIRWASTAVLKAASSPATRTGRQTDPTVVPLPDPPEVMDLGRKVW